MIVDKGVQNENVLIVDVKTTYLCVSKIFLVYVLESTL